MATVLYARTRDPGHWSTRRRRHQRLLPYGLLLGYVLCLAGCATLSKEECLRGDWYRIGWHDGARGYTQERLAQHVEACQEYRILPAQHVYVQGRQAGLAVYCTPQNGYIVGEAGADYAGVCPEAQDEAFRRAYLQGYVVHASEKAQRLRFTLVTDVQRLSGAIQALDRHSRSEADAERRKHMEREIARFRERQRRLEWSVREELSPLPLVHWQVHEGAPPAQEFRRLYAAMQYFHNEERQLRSALERLRSDVSNLQERWKKERKKP